MTPASQSGTAAARASSAARTVSPASSSRFRPRIAASTCVESVRCRPPALTRPSPFSRSSSRSRIFRSRSLATSRARNSLSTEKSKPSSSRGRPRQYFQSSRPRTASAACRSVRFSVNCSTVTIASCAGEIPGFPRVPYAAPNASSSYQLPSSSRARIASDPFRNAFLATLTVSAGTSGHGRGCIDMVTRFCGREGGRGRAGRRKDHEHHQDQDAGR